MATFDMTFTTADITMPCPTMVTRIAADWIECPCGNRARAALSSPPGPPVPGAGSRVRRCCAQGVRRVSAVSGGGRAHMEEEPLRHERGARLQDESEVERGSEGVEEGVLDEDRHVHLLLADTRTRGVGASGPRAPDACAACAEGLRGTETETKRSRTAEARRIASRAPRLHEEL